VYYLYDRYRELLNTFLTRGYRIVTVRDAATSPVSPPFVVLRHDVEWSARRAARVASIEADLGVASTFYFRADTKAFDLDVMTSMQERGFEVGYHYNTLDRAHGNSDLAQIMFEQDVAAWRRGGIALSTAAPHGDPSVRRVGYSFNSDLMDMVPALLERTKLLDTGAHGTRFPLQGTVFPVSDANMRWNRGAITWPFFSRVARERSIDRLLLLTHADYWSDSLWRAAPLRAAATGMRTLGLRSNAARFQKIIHG
jgi:hypothetical protein